jgi:hypothetical protein
VSEEYLALADGAAGFPQGVSDLAVLRILLSSRTLRLRDYHSILCDFPDTSTLFLHSMLQSYNPTFARKNGLGYFRFARHYSGNHNCFLFLGVLRCFSSPGSPTASGILYLPYRGLPHSEIFGSQVMCTFPKLIAAYHVLHRLSDPRHPPYALSNFQFLNKLYFLLTTNMSKNFFTSKEM